MKARSLFRVLRWVGLGAAVPALWACTSRSLEAPVVKPEQTFTKTFQQTVNRNVDLLFLVDDSSSMRLLQMNLERNFPQFMGALRMIPGHEEIVKFAVQRHPAHRLTTPADVARVILLMASPATQWMNGDVIRVDGVEDALA